MAKLRSYMRHFFYGTLALLLAMPSAFAAPQGDGISSSSDFNLPQIGEAGANSVTPEQEYQAGIQIMDQLRNGGAILDDPLIHEYIDNLGHQLSSHSDNP
ncbi:MAG TPA: hypothetical protein VF117_08785, partial [Gammaproteobacteria bacterium]